MGQGMVRKQVYISHEQEQLLKHLARETGSTEAHLMRESLQRMLEDEQARAALWARHMALLEGLSDEAEQLRIQGLTGGGRTWKRDELYEERFQRDAG